MLGASVASALERVAVGEVVVEAAGDDLFPEAMRIALVRITGRRSAADDPVFEPLRRDARRFVQLYLPAAGSSPARVTFDSAALTGAVKALGQPVWGEWRPVVLAVVLSAPLGADPQAVRLALERSAAERGLPLRLSAASAVGLAGLAELTPDLALAAARRVGADAALVAESDGSDWQWTLFEGTGSTAFSGGATAGIEAAVDWFALSDQASNSRPVESLQVRIVGIGSLKDYTAVERALALLPGAGRVDPLELEGSAAVFKLEVSGGAAGLAEALGRSGRFTRETVRGPVPVFRYRP